MGGRLRLVDWNRTSATATEGSDSSAASRPAEPAYVHSHRYYSELQFVTRSTGVFGSTPYNGAEERAIEVALNTLSGEHRNVVAEANRIFGFGGWSNRVTGFEVHDAHQDDDGWNVYASAMVAVTLKNGAEHQDCGRGVASGASCKGLAIIRAQRTAIDDALIRALRKFGVCFDSVTA